MTTSKGRIVVRSTGSEVVGRYAGHKLSRRPVWQVDAQGDRHALSVDWVLAFELHLEAGDDCDLVGIGNDLGAMIALPVAVEAAGLDRRGHVEAMQWQVSADATGTPNAATATFVVVGRDREAHA